LIAEDIVAEGGNVLARWSREMEGGGRLTGQTYLDLTRRKQETLEDQRSTFDIDLQYELPAIGPHTLIAGARYRDTTDDVNQTAIITSQNSRHREQLFSVFAQDQVRLSEAWRLTVGSKFDNNDYTGFEIQPTARLQWMGEGQMVWAAASRAVRSPSELEREFDVVTGVIPPGVIPAPVSVELRPSPDFESEVLVAYELGYRREWTPTLAMDVALFHNDYDGLATNTLQPFQIDFTPPIHVIAPIQITNSTDAETNGVELELNWRARDDLNVSLGYSYLIMDLDGPPASVAIAAEAAEDQSPHNQADLRLQWDATDRLSLDTTVYYVDELPGFDVNSYVRTDLRLSYRLTDHVQFDLIGQNLFDDAHREFGSVADANASNIERSIFGRLTWRS
jgi:iron complex outermembrane receptor protein